MIKIKVPLKEIPTPVKPTTVDELVESLKS